MQVVGLKNISKIRIQNTVALLKKCSTPDSVIVSEIRFKFERCLFTVASSNTLADNGFD